MTKDKPKTKTTWDPGPRNLPVLDVNNMEWGHEERDRKYRHISKQYPNLSASARRRMVKHYYDE